MSMNVHNLMEEYVSIRINELYDHLMENQPDWLTCDCEHCRWDAISYVLNKVHPHYVVSGRGVVYTAQMLDEPQLRADINALAIEAVRIIASTQRPYHKKLSENKKDNRKLSTAPSFNFPVFMGKIYNGLTFEVLPDAIVSLKHEGSLAKMQDASWSNPVKTFNSTRGSYSFWVESIPAEKENETKVFSFTVEAKIEGFSPASYAFNIKLSSDDKKITTINQMISYKIQDIFLFK